MNRAALVARRPLRANLFFVMACVGLAVAQVDSAAAAWRNWRPTISGSPPTTATVGTAYSFTPTASAPRNLTVSFSISNKPVWATFSTSSGKLSGTPTAANVGNFSNIVITARDKFASASLPAFTITVAAASGGTTSSPPVISGSPATSVVAGSPYGFTPTASDPGGKALSFSVQNKPSWAAFSISTGALSGTPTTAQVGTYGNIIITVSDGTATAALKSFSIAVTAPVTSTTGSATLTWTAPTQNTDGSPLTNLAGYHIYYGTSAGSLSNMVAVSTAGATTYTIGNLSAATWYFGVKSYTTSGNESGLSNVGSKTIQ